MRLSKKMALIGVLFMAPALWLTFTHYQALSAQIAFSANEQRGLPMVAAATRVMQPLQLCRGLMQQRLRGLLVSQTSLQTCQTSTSKAILTLIEAQAAGDDLFPGGPAVIRSIQLRWQILLSASGTGGPDKSFADYSALIKDLIGYIRSVADGSNLTLDIEVGSYYLMDSVTVDLPEQIEAAAALRGFAASRVGGWPGSAADVTRLTVLTHDLDLATERVHQDIARLADAIPRTAVALNALDTAKAQLYQNLQHELLDAEPGIGASAILFDKGSALVDAGYAALNEFSGLLDQGLEDRLARIRREITWQVSILTALLVLAVVLAKATHASALRSVSDLASATHRIASGDFTRHIEVRGTDELGQLAEAVNELQQRLKHTIDAERQLLLENQQMNAELSAANEQLEQKVEQRTQEIRKAHEGLRLAMDQVVQTEKLASLGKLVATVSHEVSTPVGVILTLASTLSEQLTRLQGLFERGAMRKSDLAELLTQGPAATELIVRNAQRVGELLNSFNRVRVDGIGLHREQFYLLDLCRDVVTLMKPAINRVGVTVELDVAPGLKLDLVPSHLQQVLQNLFENSLDHAFEPEDSQKLIRLSAVPMIGANGRREVELIYSDSGHGLRGVDPKRLFEPFYASQLGRGVRGVGLYIVHTLVYGSLNGSLLLDPKGPGFLISLRLPAMAEG
ncbi:MAG TPA: HAMP domain-containing protein [Burkholderiaceae bacterium]